MAKPSRLFVDANILLELLLPGRAKTANCEDYLLSYNGVSVVSSLSIHIVYYYCKKQGYTISQIDSFISDFEIATVGHEEYLLALNIVKDADMEDAMQIAASLNAGCDEFLTIDKQLANLYKENINIILL